MERWACTPLPRPTTQIDQLSGGVHVTSSHLHDRDHLQQEKHRRKNARLHLHYEDAKCYKISLVTPKVSGKVHNSELYEVLVQRSGAFLAVAGDGN